MPARRPGLIARKLSVQGKGGKRHQRTYWVKPNIAQIVRLRRAKKAADRNIAPEAPYVPQTEHPREGVKKAFRALGKRVDDEMADKLIEFFKKPDGTLATGEDFAALFAHPGKQVMPLREAAGGDETYGMPKTRFILNPDGSKKVEHLDVKTKIVGLKFEGKDLKVETQLWGTPLHPVGHPDEGKPIPGAAAVKMTDSNRNIERTYSKQLGASYRQFGPNEPAGIHVHHDYFIMDTKYMGGGLGSEVVGNQFKAYAKLGISDVTVTSAWLGNYVWPRAGFELTDSSKEARTAGFSDHVARMQSGSEGAAKVLYKDSSTPYTPAEIKDFYSFSGKLSPDVYGAKIMAFDFATGRMVEKQPFKDYVLAGAHNGMAGHVRVQPGDPNYEHLREYYEIRPKRGTPEGLAFDRDEAATLAKQARDRNRREAESLALLPPDQQAARILEIKAKRTRVQQAEEAALREGEARQLQALTDSIREPIMNPPGHETITQLEAHTEDLRLPVTSFMELKGLGVGARAAWVAQAEAKGESRVERERAVKLLTGELNMTRAQAYLEIASRHEALGDSFAAGRAREAAAAFRELAITQAHRDATAGNTNALSRISEVEGLGLRSSTEANARRASLTQGLQAQRDAITVSAGQRAAARNVANAAQDVEFDRSLTRAREASRVAEVARVAAATTAAAGEGARLASVGQPPAARPRATSAEGATLAGHQTELQYMSPEQRAQYLQSSPYGSASGFRHVAETRVREQAMAEMTGAAAQARADYATRESAYYAGIGDTAASRSARTRARAAQTEATTRATEFAATEVQRGVRQAEITADRARAQVLLPAQQSKLASAVAAHTAARVESEAASLTSGWTSTAAYAANERVREARSQVRQEEEKLEQLRGAAAGNYSPQREAERLEARQAITAKEGRIEVRRQEELLEAPRRAQATADAARAQRALPAVQARIASLVARREQVMDKLGTMDEGPALEALKVRNNALRAEVVQARFDEVALQALTPNIVPLSSPDAVRDMAARQEGRERLIAKETRVEARRVEAEATAAREAAEKVQREEAQRRVLEKKAAAERKEQERAAKEETLNRLADARRAAKAAEADAAAATAAAVVPEAPRATPAYTTRTGVGRRSSLRVRL